MVTDATEERSVTRVGTARIAHHGGGHPPSDIGVERERELGLRAIALHDDWQRLQTRERRIERLRANAAPERLDTQSVQPLAKGHTGLFCLRFAGRRRYHRILPGMGRRRRARETDDQRKALEEHTKQPRL